MHLMIPPPKARYGVVTLTLPGHTEQFLDVGPVLVASYNRREFEVLYPFRAVVNPLAWELVETYGVLDSPDDAVRRYINNPDVADALLNRNLDLNNDGGGAVALELPKRVAQQALLAEKELLALEMGM